MKKNIKKIITSLILVLVLQISLFANTKEEDLAKQKSFILESNLVSSIIFGPSIHAEAVFGSVALHVNYTALGPGVVYSGYETDYSGTIIQGDFRYYTDYENSGINSFYLEAGLVYQEFESKSSDGSYGSADIAKVSGVGPIFGFGYRWLTGKNFTIRLGLEIGYIFSETEIKGLVESSEVDLVESTYGGITGGLNFTLGFAF